MDKLCSVKRQATAGYGSERGLHVAEFAVVAPFIIGLMLGILDAGRAIFAYTSVAQAAREATRYACVRSSESGRVATESDVQTQVLNKIGVSSVTVTTTWSPDKKPGSVVQVKVEHAFQPATPFLRPLTVASTSRMLISN
jgi:Flp pilus assembly protein TadG